MENATGGGFGAWASLGGISGGSVAFGPTVATDSAGRLQVFAVGTSGGLYYWRQNAADSSTFTGPTNLGGDPNGTPTVLADSAAQLNVVVKWRSNRVYKLTQANGSWTGVQWQDIGDPIMGTPALAWSPVAALQIFVVRPDSTLWVWEAGTWTMLGGTHASSPVAVRDSSNWVHVFSMSGAPTHPMLHFWKGTSGGWRGANDGSPGGTLGGSFSSNAAVFVGSQLGSTLHVFGRSSSNRSLQRMSFSAGTSGSSATWTTTGGSTTQWTTLFQEAQTTNVLTQHNNNARTGANTQETSLNVSNVNKYEFGKLFSFTVRGFVYAQPLYVANVPNICGGTHNVLYVATEENNVYAFDADGLNTPAGCGNTVNPSLLWQIGPTANGTSPNPGIGAPIPTPNPDFGFVLPNDPNYPHPCTFNLTPFQGITGTPVIDTATQTIYFVNFTGSFTNRIDVAGRNCHNYGTARVDSHVYQWKLHGINMLTGAERFTPVTIAGTVNAGTPDELVFDAKQHLQRAALLLATHNSTKRVFVSFGGTNDGLPFQGWLFSYPLNTSGAVSGTPNVWVSTPVSLQHPGFNFQRQGGIWQAGQGPAADASGNVYFATGNGNFSPTSGDFADSIVKFNPTSNGVSSWFAPPLVCNGCSDVSIPACPSCCPTCNDWLGGPADMDQGAGGVILLPNNRLAQGGKTGILYVLNTSSLGGWTSDASTAIQSFQATVRQDSRPWMHGHSHIHGGPVFWADPAKNGMLYVAGEADYVRQYAAAGSTFASYTQGTWITKASMPGAMLSLSAKEGSGTGSRGWGGSGVLWYAGFSADPTPPTDPSDYMRSFMGVLQAYDASDISRLLWSSEADQTGDRVGNFARFNYPTIAGGKVYVPTFCPIDVMTDAGRTTCLTQIPVYGLNPNW